MKPLPETLLKAWDNRGPIAVLTTVAKDGTPNTIYVGVVGRYDDSTFFVSNSAFFKTQQNILAGSKASLLFMTQDHKAYQIKGSITLEESGPLFEAAKKITPPEYLCRSAAVLRVEAAFSGAEPLM
jgi:predicted pyridoxine 5'-phosphate oxidase superfamily flavin-nucleotide-binding protein